jgi:hypothetical protein
MITNESIALVIYSGETDDIKSVEIIDIGPALRKEAARPQRVRGTEALFL